MNKFLHIIILSMFLGACTSNTILKKPKDLIPKEEMVDLLTDIFIANGAMSVKNTNLKRNVNYFPFVFEKYKIDTTRFKESNYYYTSRIDDYDYILGKVDKRLKALKHQYENDLKIRDSIKRIEKDSLRKVTSPKKNKQHEIIKRLQKNRLKKEIIE
ncbi:hypothetical protein Lupro_08145 [Lutibacter profundi]|uniref:DUF4296 domain-containing protein n=1 Tax=Lutibacter profundi TaxID=1622118 RepID=A0A109RNQ6_9FLAO|nr:DUF4296 domain-containing protein [Lutibacter profundi]AMC11227.1 hypothetical protein Lupro_08145 [Lutibacter profundi]